MKKLFIAEKPSVANEFAKVIGNKLVRHDGYSESEDSIFTWCVGHLVGMSYPECYDPKYAKWNLADIPFIPDEFLYEILANVKKQFNIVSKLLLREDVEVIYVCTDSGREGEYIYRLIEEMIERPKAKRLRVWIDSQTEDEIRKGIEKAKPLEEYDNLSDSAYLRAKEDYLMGINFSRLLTLKFSRNLSEACNKKWVPIATGRVMSCVLGMVVKREQEIRNFEKKEYFKVILQLNKKEAEISAEWKHHDESRYPFIRTYKGIGFDSQDIAKDCIDNLGNEAVVTKSSKKTENKNPPFLYNLAELQNECSKSFKISPTETLDAAQELYEKKLITYPRTDAKVLSKAVAKEIHKNLSGLANFPKYGVYAKEILDKEYYKKIIKSKYVDDKKITDHYAIIPTGEGFNNFDNLNNITKKIYGKILIRFLSIMYPAAKYENLKLEFMVGSELFTMNDKVLKEKGYLEITGLSKSDKLVDLPNIKKGDIFTIKSADIKEQETSPPQRYNSGTIILAMENAGSFIEDEELRLTIKGAGIGTSATRAEIISKLDKNSYIEINKKTQVIKPTYIGECIYHIIDNTIPALLNPTLTASWEKGLNMVANGEINKDVYMDKLTNFVVSKVETVKGMNSIYNITIKFKEIAKFY